MPDEAAREPAADEARRLLHEWNGYDPDEDEIARLDAELDRRLAEARG
ncbi:hypothetical protein [Streptomyces albireticuli]|nr:hypothetical protein [Streptomyces albireticuli]MCD9144680.1 hypothetical protein [Streptomyces albireticuli]MCD9165428.1 hypothetical protein [Streptomyces albireticuli]MCD9193587.1 hypothetical protein [Streptomyces albireticuli]